MTNNYFRRSGTRRRTAALDKKITDIFLNDVLNKLPGYADAVLFVYDPNRNALMVMDNMTDIDTDIAYRYSGVAGCKITARALGHVEVMVPAYNEYAQFFNNIETRD